MSRNRRRHKLRRRSKLDAAPVTPVTPVSGAATSSQSAPSTSVSNSND